MKKTILFSLGGLLLVVVVGAVAFVLSQDDAPSAENLTADTAKEFAQAQDVRIKHLGITIDTYDPATNMAGDIQFTTLPAIEGGLEAPFLEYGRTIPATSAGPERSNPQPTIIAPLGTKVHSLVDGEVIQVPQLYSGDYSVMVQPKGSDLVFETEHVINVQVQVGDQVSAGDVIAEVSDYDARNIGGLGLYEIGILVPGNPPSHVCPFDYLDESIKDDTLTKLAALQDAWEEYIGDNDVYNQAEQPTVGCATLSAIEG